MQYMLAIFNLRPEASVDEFTRCLHEFDRHMREMELIHSVGPLSQRCPDTLLDTDERRQQYGFVTRFRDADQSRRAIAYLSSSRDRPATAHEAMHAMIADAVFSFWEEMPAAGGNHDPQSPGSAQ